jgi:hypothetical protein
VAEALESKCTSLLLFSSWCVRFKHFARFQTAQQSLISRLQHLQTAAAKMGRSECELQDSRAAMRQQG